MPEIDLRSDTMTRPTPAMRRAMAEAEVGDDVWREDPTTRRLEAAVAERFGREAAMFVPSGTMGNQVCLRVAAAAGTELLCGEDNHVVWYESGAAAALSGIQVHTIPTERGRLRAANVAPRLRSAIYGAPTSAVAVEQTHNRGGGTITPLDDLVALHELTGQAGVHLHCDGARIWNAAVATGIDLADWGAAVDSLSVCFSKGLAAPVGSAVVGDADFVERARRARQQLGGGMRQVGVLAAAAQVAIDTMVERLADDHANAAALAATVGAAVPGAVDPAQVETNIVMLDARAFGTDAPGLAARLAERGVGALPVDPAQVRLVFHWEVDAGAAARAAAAVVDCAA